VAGIPLKDFWAKPVQNCSVTVLSLENGQLRLEEATKIYYE
jgi:exonuclease VII small subunit